MLACDPMTLRQPLLGALLCALAATTAVLGQEEPVLIDRVLAVVDEDPILQSEVEQAVRLKMIEPAAAEDDRSLRRRALDQLIEQRLRFHEIDSFGFVEMSPDEVEAAFNAVRGRFADDAEFTARLEELGLGADSLRQLVARQLMVLTYVDDRLGPRVFVDLDDIRTYYDETLVPKLKGEGVEPPPLQQVREQIRGVLKEERLNAEIETWTEELRRQADVEDYFDEVEGEMPGVVAASAAAPNSG
jgi:peptidyl-prolyl cis-trans isomerase SurA